MFWVIDMYQASAPPSFPNAAWWTLLVERSLVCGKEGIQLAAHLLQLHLNYVCGTFAGDYALSALIRVAGRMVVMLGPYVLRIFGGSDTPAANTNELVSMATCILWAYQALTLPRVEQDEPETAEE